MNKDDIRKIFSRAAEIVDSLSQQLQPIAFKIAVQMLLAEDETLVINDTERLANKQESDSPERMDALAREIGVDDVRILHTVYDISPAGEIKIILKLGNENADTQRRTAYLYLFAKLICEGQDWVSAVDLSRELKRHGAYDGHVSQNLGTERKMILCAGIKKGKKYSLTPAGVNQAKEILKELLH